MDALGGYMPLIPFAVCAVGVGPLYTAIRNRLNAQTQNQKLLKGKIGQDNDEKEKEKGKENIMSEKDFLWCVASGNFADVLRGLDEGVKVNAVDPADGCSALFLAAEAGDERITKLLMERGADLELRNQNGSTPLFIACSKGHISVVTLFVERGADINARCTRQEMTPLFITALQGYAKLLRYLLEDLKERAGEIRAIDCLDLLPEDGYSLLHAASESGNLPVVELLVKDYGASVNCQALDGTTPLLIASQAGFHDIVSFLLAMGADASIVNKRNATALSLATLFGHTRIVEILIPYTSKEQREECLILAIKLEKAAIVPLLQASLE